MSDPVGAFVSKSRLITLSSWSRLSTTDRSSSGTKLEGKTIRSCRLRRKGCMCRSCSTGMDGAGRSGTRLGWVTTPSAADSSLDRSDEVGAELTSGDDRVNGSHGACSLDVVHLLELLGHVAELLRPHRGAQLGKLQPDLGLSAFVRLGQLGFELGHPGVLGGARGDLPG